MVSQCTTNYHKVVLQCHPDKLPPDASKSERDAATKEFHRISQAYKTLSEDTQKANYDTMFDGKALGSRRDRRWGEIIYF